MGYGYPAVTTNFGYTLWKHYAAYSAAMDREQHKLMGGDRGTP